MATHLIVTGTIGKQHHTLTDDEWSYIFRILDLSLRATAIDPVKFTLASMNVDASMAGDVAHTWAQNLGLFTRTFYPDWANNSRYNSRSNPNPAGHINARHMLRTVVRNRARRDVITVLAFTHGSLESNTIAAYTLEISGRRHNAVTHHYRLDTFTKEF